jgi:hypothetical protein
MCVVHSLTQLNYFCSVNGYIESALEMSVIELH